MIKATLTTTMGTTREMSFNDKVHLLEFIELMGSTLHQGVAVCIDAPIIGIHNGWIQGKLKQKVFPRSSASVMGALFFCVYFLYSMYHTSGQNIQILGYLGFTNFFRKVI